VVKPSKLLAVTCVLATLAFGATAAAAECRLNGRIYPVGTVVGSLVCTDRGWTPRSR